ncbi:MAG TPA: hypothetical protein PKV40_08295, partial [Candidatus Kapabacteria bacterium]|nr:hypothetical protein [Candidatus Kapabacteria bacterium]
MKKNIILFFLILSCLSFSSCSHNNKSQDYVYKNITIKNGEKLVQGKEYEVNYRIDHPSNKQYSISVQYQQEKINNFQILSYKLDKIDSIHFAAKIKILPNTSFMTFSLYLPKGELIDISKKIPVYKNSNQLEYGANGALLTNADKSSYLKYFYDERKLYPDNLAIYATRWYYEIGAQLINKDSVLDQIQYLEKNYNAHTTLPLLQIIAYTINYDKTKIDEAIQNIPKVKFDKSLCNWELSSLLNDILFGNDSLHPEQTRLIREQLIQNNPYSFYTHSLINMGVLWNNKNIDSNISINVINKVIDHKPNILNPYITKGI